MYCKLYNDEISKERISNTILDKNINIDLGDIVL